MSGRNLNERYGVKRPIQQGGVPVHIDVNTSLDRAIDDVKYWHSQGEQAILVKESIAQDSTWWIEIKGY